MKPAARVSVALLMLCTSAGGSYAQPRPSGEFLPVPDNVKAEGLPPIPSSYVSALAPYAGFRC